MSKKVWRPNNIYMQTSWSVSVTRSLAALFSDTYWQKHKVCSCHMFWQRIDNLERTTYFPPSSQSWTLSWSSHRTSWPRPKQSQTLPRKCQRWRNSSQIEWLATIGCSTIHVSVQTSCVSIQTSCSHCQKSMISNSLGNSWSFLSQVVQTAVTDSDETPLVCVWSDPYCQLSHQVCTVPAGWRKPADSCWYWSKL